MFLLFGHFLVPLRWVIDSNDAYLATIYDVLVCLVDLRWPQNEVHFIPP